MERLKVEADYFGIEGMTKIIGGGKKKVDEPKVLSAEYDVRAAELYKKADDSIDLENDGKIAYCSRCSSLNVFRDREKEPAKSGTCQICRYLTIEGNNPEISDKAALAFVRAAEDYEKKAAYLRNPKKSKK